MKVQLGGSDPTPCPPTPPPVDELRDLTRVNSGLLLALQVCAL